MQFKIYIGNIENLSNQLNHPKIAHHLNEIHDIRTKGYYVIGIYVFPWELMKFSRKKGQFGPNFTTLNLWLGLPRNSVQQADLTTSILKLSIGWTSWETKRKG